MNKQRGFTLIELMIVVSIIDILSAVAVPSFMRYIRRAKTIEAAMNVRKLYDGTVSYYEAEHVAFNGAIVAKQFPSGVAGTPPRAPAAPRSARNVTRPLPPGMAVLGRPSLSRSTTHFITRMKP